LNASAAQDARRVLQGNVAMSATVHALGRLNTYRGAVSARPPRAATAPSGSAPGNAWLVDVGALAKARALLSGHEPLSPNPGSGAQALLEVPPAYEQFCRSHFTSVRRLHPDMRWEDACQAYAVALSAHAVLCDGLDAARERALAEHWPHIRGDSRLEWQEAGSLVADGCRALARLDPLAMRR